MTRKISNLKELVAILEKSEGYCIGATIFDGKNLEHHLLTKTFPKTDLTPSWGKINDLIHNEKGIPTAEVIDNVQNS